MRISENVALVSTKAARRLVALKFHSEYIFHWLRKLFQSQNSGSFSAIRAEFVSATLDLATALIKNHAEARAEFLNALRIEDVLFVPIREVDPNIYCLCSAYRGLSNIIMSLPLYSVSEHQHYRDVEEARDLFAYITQVLMDDNLRLVRQLQPQEVPNLAKSVSLHSRLDALRRGIEPTQSTHSNQLDKLFSPIFHNVYGAILDLINFYLENSGLEYAIQFNEAAETQQRERALVAVCHVPSDQVRQKALKCLSLAPLKAFKKAEIGDLLSLQNKLLAVDAGDTLLHLRLFYQILARLVEDGITAERDVESDAVYDMHPGVILKVNWKGKVLSAAFNALTIVMQAGIPMEPVERETRRVEACYEISRLLRIASSDSDYRPLMREENILSMYGPILKAEETLGFMAQDTCIERTWGGRDLEMLLSCLKASEETKSYRLSVHKKTAFRVMARIADLLGGTSDAFERSLRITLRQMSTREQEFWGEPRDAMRKLYFLDPEEAVDRVEQGEAFNENNGLGVVARFVSTLVTRQQIKDLQEARRRHTTFDYWASRLKGQKEEAESAIAANSTKWQAYVDRIGIMDEVPVEPHMDSVLAAVSLEQEPPGAKKEDSSRFSGRWLVCHALQQVHQAYQEATCMLPANYSRQPTPSSHDLGANSNCLRPAFIVSAFLRVFFGALVVPPSDDLWRAATQQLREPHTVQLLIHLCDLCDNDVMICTKVASVLNYAFEMEPHQPAESMDLIIPYGMAMRWLTSQIEAMTRLVNQATLKPLSRGEEFYCQEAIRLCRTVARQTLYIKFSEIKEVQVSQNSCVGSLLVNATTR
eukprot:Blabericola_migrator_1__154@NODE_1040_length_5626_cov_5_586796_g716_i0_p1_GENE_NODE_1040_length_5626_cov_5_586796_g716_i0NODE_1040_length_5626_cov_5_586796_g716_i0_p1_ORF_typecomplete_len819_score161_11XET_C/PF06955_12/0_11_NODE_1040_length_5626_cov_5_586796_g716_i027095165